LFDAARAAIKGTPKADKNTVAETLNAASKMYPARTVAEMLVIIEHQDAGTQIQDLEDEANALIKKRQQGIGFSKAGWIPALKELLPLIGKESVSIGGLQRPAFGGAEPAKQVGSELVGSVFNDVQGTGNFPKVESIKEEGAEFGREKVANDIATYLERELGEPIERFNSSH
jgi:hypothetical protein